MSLCLWDLSPMGLSFLLCKGEAAAPPSQGYGGNGEPTDQRKPEAIRLLLTLWSKGPLTGGEELNQEWKGAEIGA